MVKFFNNFDLSFFIGTFGFTLLQGKVPEIEDLVVIFEFKMDSSAEAALAQIIEKKHAERYGKKDKELVLIGVNFDSAERNITDYKVENPSGF